MIEIKNVTLQMPLPSRNRFQTILNSISCTIPSGRITTIIGKSGSGKTSLLRCIAGLTNHYQGQITVDGINLEQLSAVQRSATIGFVAQRYTLFPHMTVLTNCTQPLIITKGLSKDMAQEKACTLLKQFGLLELAQQYPHHISGGQQQRVAIIRAVLLEPKVLLLDEPTSALDPENSLLIAHMLKQLTTQGITSIVSSQDMSFVHMIKDCLYVMEDGQIINR
jgi:ABC-type polar amino acid transport system ATPase subunit